MKYNDLVYGTDRRRTTRHLHEDTSDEVAELGKTAIKGVVTVGAVGITAALVGGVLGGMQK